ncbi:hypothetical protein BJV82DRAFT_664893 [Fennellomyces sp. T-0311]|nr:hypothetical protein BJV82DRAFT_664893 [Fennellomyces sp. T-0311]
MPSAFRTACEPFDRARPPALTHWHPLFFFVECFYALVPFRVTQRRPRLPDGVARSMYDLQRVIDKVMENQLALEQLEHGIHAINLPIDNPSFDLEAIKRKHADAMDRLKRHHEKELDRIEAEHKKKLDRLHENHEQVYERMKEHHEDVYRHLELKHQDALDRTTTRYEKRNQEAEDRVAYLEQQLANESSRKKQLDLLVRENGEEVQRVTAELIQQQEQIDILTERLAHQPSVNDAHVQTDPLEQEQLREQLGFYKQQVQVRMQQFYEQEKMVSRLQEHVAILHEQLERKQKQSSAREARMLDLMDKTQQLREEREAWVSRHTSLV